MGGGGRHRLRCDGLEQGSPRRVEAAAGERRPLVPRHLLAEKRQHPPIPCPPPQSYGGLDATEPFLAYHAGPSMPRARAQLARFAVGRLEERPVSEQVGRWMQVGRWAGRGMPPFPLPLPEPLRCLCCDTLFYTARNSPCLPPSPSPYPALPGQARTTACRGLPHCLDLTPADPPPAPRTHPSLALVPPAPRATQALKFRELSAAAESAGLYSKRKEAHYWLLYAYLAALYASTWLLVAHQQLLAASLTIGMFWGQLAFVGHDVCHGAVHGSKRLMRVAALAVNALLGIGCSHWTESHNAHHAFVNSTDHDPEVEVSQDCFRTSFEVLRFFLDFPAGQGDGFPSPQGGRAGGA